MTEKGAPLDLGSPVALGPFEIHKVLGVGGMGVVWWGRHTEQGVPAAIKVLSAGMSRESANRSLFQDEVRKAARFDHPGIVTVFDFGTITEDAAEESRRLRGPSGRDDFALQAGNQYLAMEYCSHGSLERQIPVLRWSDTRAILLALLDALAHAHARGVIHRDLKPANILFTDASFRAIKLTDFGVALAHGALTEALDPDHTAGTPFYMAPEQFGEWRDQGPWTDLYALGVVAYEMAAGRRPFSGNSVMELAAAHMLESVPDFAVPSGFPPEFDGWVMRLLCKAPSDRFACASDAAHALHRLGDTVAPETPRLAPSTWVRTDSSSGRSEKVTTDYDSEAETRPVMAAVSLGDLSRKPSELPELHEAPIPATWERAESAPEPMSLVGAGAGLYQWRVVPFVGRREERDRVWDALLDVQRTGRTRLVVLGGDAGCGKSRLAGWMTERALEVGAAATLLRADHDAESPRDGLPRMLAECFRCVGLDLEGTRERVAAVLDEFGSTDPYDARAAAELVTRGAGLKTPAQRYAVVARVLQLLARSRPVLLWLEDLHHGADTLDFVQYLLRTQDERPLPVLVLATCRTDLLAERRLESELLAEVQARSETETLHLGPLTEAEHRELIQQLLRLEGELAERVARRTEGNPLFAVELVGDWVARGVLRVAEDGFVLAPGERGEIPDTIHAVWQARLESALSAAPGLDGRSLEVAAALGREVNLDEWASACKLLGCEERDALVQALLAAHLAEPRDGGMAFCHAMLRDSIRHMSREGGRWAKVNQACADMLRPRAGEPGISRRLGRHLLAAGKVEEAFEPLLGGARECVETSDYREAGELVELALELLERLGAAQSDARRGEVLLVRSRVLVGLGDFKQAERLAARVAETARRKRWKAVYPVALRLQGTALSRLGDLGLAETVLMRAQSEAQRSGDVQGALRALCQLSVVSRQLGDFQRALEHGEQAISEAEELDDTRGRADAQAEVGHAKMGLEQFEEAIVHLRRALEHYDELEQQYGLAICHNSLGDLFRRTGDLESALEAYTRAERVLERIGSPDRIYPMLNTGFIPLEQGAFEAAAEVFERTLDLAARTQRRHLQGCCHAALLPCLAVSGDWTGWERHMGEAEALLEETGTVEEDVARSAQSAGDLAAAAGRNSEAEQAYRLALAQWEAMERESEVMTVTLRLSGDGGDT